MVPKSLARLLEPPAGLAVDFTQPKYAAALVPHQGVSWRIFANPLSAYIAGIAAVILELAEPSVRSGVWDHSSFRTDPRLRLRRTGFAAYITVYAPRAVAEQMIARVVKRHELVQGTTHDGQPYHANDPRLLTWVHATALWGFSESYHSYVAPLSPAERDQAFHEGQQAARLYGADAPPGDWAQWQALLSATPLQDSAVLAEFLEMMATAPILPRPMRFVQALLLRAAVDLVPQPIRSYASLQPRGLRPGEARLVRLLGKLALHLPIAQLPPAQAAKRFS